MDIIRPKIVYKINGEKISFDLKIVELALFAVWMDTFPDGNLKSWVKHYFSLSLDHGEDVKLEIECNKRDL